MSDEKPAPRNPVDWEAVEREYRAGQLSVSEIGRLQGISHTAINKRAAKLGWKRDLAQRVRQEVSARLVSEGVSATNVRETIELAAERDIQLVREHRQDIGNGRKLVSALFDELKQASENRADIEAAIEVETTSGDGKIDFKRRQAMLRAVSLGGRSSAVAALSVAMRNLVGLERQAFNLSDKPDGGGDPSGGSVEFKTVYESAPRD